MKAWKKFCDTYRLHGEKLCSREQRANFSRFSARHRLATNFEGVAADSYSRQTLRGYSSGFRLLLAYSATEILAQTLNQKLSDWSLTMPELAKKLRVTLTKPVARSEALFRDRKLRNNLSAFMGGDDNLIHAATAVRVMVAHGTFTPSGTDSLSRAGAGHIDALADLLLAESSHRFAGWLHQRLIEVTQVR